MKSLLVRSRQAKARRTASMIAAVKRFKGGKVSFKSKSKSATKTRTKKKSKKNKLFNTVRQQEAGIVTKSFTTIYQKGNGRKITEYANHRLIPTINYRNQNYGSMYQVSGFQHTHSTVSALMTGPELLEMFPLVSNTGTNYNLGVVSTKGTTGNMMITEASQEISYTNNCNATIKYKFYDIIARQDTSTSDLVRDPAKWWAECAKRDDLTDTAQQIIEHVGASPFDHRAWCQRFKVVKIHTGYLLPGQTHVHMQKVHVNNIFDWHQINTLGAIKGKSTYVMVTLEGVPCTEDSGSVVSTSPFDAIYLRKEHYDIKVLPQVKDNNCIIDNLSTLTNPVFFPYNNTKSTFSAI